MKNYAKPWFWAICFWLSISILVCAPKKGCAQTNAQLSEFPRIVPRTFTYSQVFPVGNKDFVRNAFVRVTSGPDTILYFVDYYGNANVVKGKGGNGIYGGSGTVPSNVTATVTDRITFSGTDDFGTDAPFKVVSNGNEPGIMTLRANGDSLTFERSDTEFIIDGRPGLNVGSAAGKTLMFAGTGAEIQADSLVIFTGGGQSVVVDESGRVGIGTTNPQYRLHTTNDALIGNMIVQDVAGEFLIGNKGLSSFSTNFALDQNASGQTVFNGSDLNFRVSQVAKAVVTSSLFDFQVNTRFRNVLIEDYAQIVSNAASIPLSATITDNVYNAGTPPASVDFVLPPSPVDGQICNLFLFAPLAGLTVNPGSFALAGTPPGGAWADGSSLTFKFYSALGSWAVVDYLQR